MNSLILETATPKGVLNFLSQFRCHCKREKGGQNDLETLQIKLCYKPNFFFFHSEESHLN